VLVVLLAAVLVAYAITAFGIYELVEAVAWADSAAHASPNERQAALPHPRREVLIRIEPRKSGRREPTRSGFVSQRRL
jgi:hypothetical protein